MIHTTATGRTYCDTCRLAIINGFPCHETGCPDAWRDGVRECKECGARFKPDAPLSRFCSDECWRIHNGIHDESEEP